MMKSPPTLGDSQHSPVPAALAGYIQPTLGHALRVWWAFYWRTTVVSGVLTAIATYALREIYENTIISANLISWASKLNPYVFFYAVAIFVMRFVLHKRFRHFRIAVWPQGGSPTSNAGKPPFRRVLRVWWAYSWRSAIYGFVGTVVVGYPMGLTVGLFAPSPIILSLFQTGLGTVVGAAVGLYVIYSNILDEDIADFHVGLLPIESPAIVRTDPLPSAAS